jgi:hypothetical protein
MKRGLETVEIDGDWFLYDHDNRQYLKNKSGKLISFSRESQAIDFVYDNESSLACDTILNGWRII